MRDAGEDLGRLLLARAGGDARIVAARSTAWMSLMFDGRRHRFLIAMPAPLVARFRDGIEEADFALRDGFVADIITMPERDLVRIEALVTSDPPVGTRARRSR